MTYNNFCRWNGRQCPGVAQFGSALEWGSRGREFDSRHSDQNASLLQAGVFRCVLRKCRQSAGLRGFGCGWGKHGHGNVWESEDAKRNKICRPNADQIQPLASFLFSSSPALFTMLTFKCRYTSWIIFAFAWPTSCIAISSGTPASASRQTYS